MNPGDIDELGQRWNEDLRANEQKAKAETTRLIVLCVLLAFAFDAMRTKKRGFRLL
jgi:hypothetical protein